jgi:probable HAF family extracellular repeat protein
MKKSSQWIMGLLVLVVACVVPQSAFGDTHGFLWENGTMIDLGTIGVKGAVAINNNRQIVGKSAGYGFIWQNGQMTNLGSLGGSGNGSDARDINDNGQVVGTYLSSSGITRAFLWQNGVMTDIGTFGGYSVAKGINNNGQIFGASQDITGQVHTFLVDNGIMIDLGTQFGAQSINNSGTIAGYMGIGAVAHAAVWENGSITDLGVLPGCDISVANGINNANQVVGKSWLSTDSTRQFSFIWENGEMKPIGSLGGIYTEAASINDDGLIVGTSTTEFGDFHAFLYQEGKMEDLGNLRGIVSDTSHARDINNLGQIVGISDANAFPLPPGPVPLPPTVLLLGSGLLGLVGWRRFRKG